MGWGINPRWPACWTCIETNHKGWYYICPWKQHTRSYTNENDRPQARTPMVPISSASTSGVRYGRFETLHIPLAALSCDRCLVLGCVPVCCSVVPNWRRMANGRRPVVDVSARSYGTLHANNQYTQPRNVCCPWLDTLHNFDKRASNFTQTKVVLGSLRHFACPAWPERQRMPDEHDNVCSCFPRKRLTAIAVLIFKKKGNNSGVGNYP